MSVLTHAKLVRINKATQAVEPWLADSWSASEDGRAFTLKLHPGVTFSDGQPLTADDVVFSFQAVYELGPEGPLGDSLQVQGRKLEVAAVDASTVSIVFPVTYAPRHARTSLRILLPQDQAGTGYLETWSGSQPVVRR